MGFDIFGIENDQIIETGVLSRWTFKYGTEEKNDR